MSRAAGPRRRDAPSLRLVVLGIAGTVLVTAIMLVSFTFGGMLKGWPSFGSEELGGAALAIFGLLIYALPIAALVTLIAVAVGVPAFYGARRFVPAAMSARAASALAAFAATIPSAVVVETAARLLLGGNGIPTLAVLSLGAGWFIGVPIAWLFGSARSAS